MRFNSCIRIRNENKQNENINYTTKKLEIIGS